MKKLCCFVCFAFILSFPGVIFGEITLSFDEAVSKTLSLSPRLHIAGHDIQEKAGVKIQSLLYPNPVFAYSVENIWGNKEWHGWNAAESRYEVAQLFELGGKRRFRQQRATFQYYAAQAGFEVEQLAILNRLLRIFVAVVADQENLKISVNQLQIAKEAHEAVSAKLEAGKVSQIQQNKAAVALSMAKINLQRAQTEFLKNKERLSILWGSSRPNFDRVQFPFYEIDEPTSLEECLTNLRGNPQLLRAHLEHYAAHYNVNLEKAIAIPDVTFTLGYKTAKETGNRGFILGASMPLPFFNQNQGNVHTARAQLLKTQDRYQQLELALENKFSIAHKESVRAYREAEMIRSTVLQAAVQSFELAKIGYKEGKFEYLDMLDSQKTLFEVRERYNLALLSYHQSLADTEYLNVQDDNI